MPPPPAPLVDSGGAAGSDSSDGGSSGYWSVGRCDGSPEPSPPASDGTVSPATPPDEGLDMELDPVPFEEPVTRRRRVSSSQSQIRVQTPSDPLRLVVLTRVSSQNSGKTVFKCLWPSCSKVLTSVVGIKRHIRITHLR